VSARSAKLAEAMSSPRHTNRYTEAQVLAYLKAVLVDGHTVAGAVRAAAMGELGVPAFKLNQRYAYQLRDRRRESFEAGNEQAMSNGTQKALKRLHGFNLAKARDLTNKADPAEIARVAKATADSYKALQGATPRTTQPKATVQTTTANHDAEPNGDTLSKLMGLTSGQGGETGSFPRSLNGPAAA
jgi:hypothetical protein